MEKRKKNFLKLKMQIYSTLNYTKAFRDDAFLWKNFGTTGIQVILFVF